MRTVYLHGLPGAPNELGAFGKPAPAGWIAPDRGQLPAASTSAAHFAALAQAIAGSTKGEPYRLAGFSLGAVAAIRVCRYLPAAPTEMHLISPAAPLQAGDFLPRMAGRHVFALAAARPRLFRLLGTLQGGLARCAPDLLVKMLFADVRGEDRALAADSGFRRMVGAAMRCSLGPGRTAYCREVEAYTRDWSYEVETISAPVHLWHGSEDNWSPPEMSEWLARRLPNVVAMHRLANRSHYSTLAAWLAADAISTPPGGPIPSDSRSV